MELRNDRIVKIIIIMIERKIRKTDEEWVVFVGESMKCHEENWRKWNKSRDKRWKMNEKLLLSGH